MREPVPIQNPSDTDRTEGIASVTIRTPDSSVARRCSWITAALRARALRVAVPDPTQTWFPVGHAQVVTMVHDALRADGFTVQKEQYALSSDGVARLMARGEGTLEASMVKAYVCRAAEWVTREAMQIHGGMGYAEEFPVSRYFVDARVLSIFEGADETLALKVIARRLVEAA